MTSKDDLPYWCNNKTAIKLWEAFNRLVNGSPERVESFTVITQSLVAAEAGYQRSIINKNKYPDLCKLISLSAKGKRSRSMHEMFKAKSLAAKNLRNKLEEERAMNGKLINQIANMEIEIIRLNKELSLCRKS